ncbi:hypothetical protein BT69DRAFT_1342645 [Atractiella rhizophila]|nr:hypothetical protein BT69DRAFT_1342645 [Atractiella rhizophila]
MTSDRTVLDVRVRVRYVYLTRPSRLTGLWDDTIRYAILHVPSVFIQKIRRITGYGGEDNMQLEPWVTKEDSGDSSSRVAYSLNPVIRANNIQVFGYEFVKALVSAISTTPQHTSEKTSDLYKKTLALLTQLDSQAEDNDDPFNAAFSGWRPSSLNNVRYRDGLKMFATLWKRLQRIASVSEVTLRALKAYLCAAAERIHTILLSEDMRMELEPDEIKAVEVVQIFPLKIDSSKKKNKRRKLDSGGDLIVKSTFSSGATSHALPGDNESPSVTINPYRAAVHYFFDSVKWKEVPGQLKPKHKEGDKNLGRNHCSIVLRSSVASNGNTKTLCNHLVENHGRTVVPHFRLLKEKRKSCMEIKDINDILSRAMEEYNTQGFDSTIFADLLNRVVVEEDLPFLIVDSPTFQELLIYLQ